MPHITLEYSANVPGPVDAAAFFQRLHDALVAQGPFKLDDFKSRAYVCERYRVGGGGACRPARAFAHLTLAVLDRHDVGVRRAAGEVALALLRDTFARALAETDCDVTVEVRAMEGACYLKYRSPARPPD